MLIGTSDVRSWLGLKEGEKTPNDKLEALILSVQDFVESYTNRELEGTYYNNHPDFSYFDGNGKNWIYLKQYPISWVDTVYVDSDRTWSSGTLIASADLVIDWTNGKLYSEAGYFSKGHRNIKINYIAGYGASAVSSYPLPYDLKQVMIEMVTQTLNEGITGLHTVQGAEESKAIQMLSQNSIWRNTLNKYKNYSSGLDGGFE